MVRIRARVHPASLTGRLRPAWLIVLVGALLAALVVVSLVLGQLRPDAEELVRRSMDVHAAPPAFVMTVAHDSLARVRIVTRRVYEGDGRLRTECYWDTDDLEPAAPEAVPASANGNTFGGDLGTEPACPGHYRMSATNRAAPGRTARRWTEP